MKKIFPIVMILLLGISGIGISTHAHTEQQTLTETIQFSDIQITENRHSTNIVLNEANTYLYSAEKPIIPYYYKTYQLPFGTLINKVEVTFSNPMDYHLTKKLATAAQPTAVFNKNTIHANVNSYEDQPDMYPETRFTYTIGAGTIEQKHMALLTVRFYPIRYLQDHQKIEFSNEVTITITYELPEPQPAMTTEQYDLVIIAPEKYEAALQPLIDHKTAYNVPTFFKSVEDIYNEYPGRDEAEQIKYFIKDAFDNNSISYVLLVGGRDGQTYNWLVPVRYSYADDGHEQRYISDLYYADLYRWNNDTQEWEFEDWDSNGNGIFGEFTLFAHDKIDHIPDVSVGRLPCRNRLEVKLMVNKIITYEDGKCDDSWFKKIVLIGGDSAPGDPYYEGEEEGQQALEYLGSGFEGVKLWTSLETFTSMDDVISGISEGSGFLLFDGHGNPQTWSTHPPNNGSSWITGLNNKNMYKLSNGNKLPVTVVGGCHNGQFNVTLMNLVTGLIKHKLRYFHIPTAEDPFLGPYFLKEWVPECWAWRLTRKIGGGGIAIMAYTGLDWFAVGNGDNDTIPDCTQYLSGFCNTHFFKNYGVNNMTILGQAHSQTLIDYIETHPTDTDRLDCKTVEEFTLLGDPSLQIGGYE